MLKLYCMKKKFDFPIPLPFSWEETPFIGDWTQNVNLKDSHGTKFGPVEKANFVILLPNYGISILLSNFLKVIKDPTAEFVDLLNLSSEVIMINEDRSKVERYAKEKNLPWSWMEDRKNRRTINFVVCPYNNHLFLSGLQVREPNNPFF